MTSDRLQRCNYWARGHYHLAKDKRHLFDPVENHALWGKSKPKAQILESERTKPTPPLKPNSYQSEEIWGFAEYLYGMEDYRRARTEYQKFIYLSPQAVRAEEANFKIGICLQREGKYRPAIDHFNQWETHYPQGKLIKEAKFQTGYSYFLLGDYEKGIYIFNQLRNEVKSKTWQSKLDYTIGWSWLKRRDWYKTSLTLQKAAEYTSDEGQAAHLREIAALAQKGEALPRRSPVLAGLFSSLLPGSGRAYCGRFGDAFYSFMLIAGTAYASRYYYLHHHSTQAFIFGSMSLFFYAGDIYGSIKGAEISNSQAQKGLLNQIEEKLKKEKGIINNE